ncbi:MAG: DUF805 domain-containing protein [Litorimonas sp.]
MGFADAVKAFFNNYTNFGGRASRSEYWWPQLAMVIVNYLIILPITYMLSQTFGSILSLIFTLAIIIPAIAVVIRRLHDTDKSGWWILLILVPIIGWIALIVFYCTKGTDGPNRFGPDPLGHDASVFN